MTIKGLTSGNSDDHRVSAGQGWASTGRERPTQRTPPAFQNFPPRVPGGTPNVTRGETRAVLLNWENIGRA